MPIIKIEVFNHFKGKSMVANFVVSDTARTSIILSQDPEIKTLLADLGINITKSSLLTEDMCKEAGLPFEFFKRFASLTTVGSHGSALKHFEKKSQPSREVKQQTDGQDAELQNFAAVLKQQTDGQDAGLQSFADVLLDGAETALLKLSLAMLDSDGEIAKAGNGLGHGHLKQPASVKEKLSELGNAPCWLTTEAMKKYLFGRINGETNYQLGAESFMGIPIPFSRTTSLANEFECPYLPTMAEHSKGLFFKPENMPPKIEATANSTVILEIGNGRGSGVVALHPNYILTARHVIGKPEVKDGKKTVPLKVKYGDGKVLETRAEVIDILGEPFDNAPDLSVLYVPDLPRELIPLQFTKNHGRPIKPRTLSKTERQLFLNNQPVNGERLSDTWKTASDGLFEIILGLADVNATGARRYDSQRVFLIGAPTQRTPVEKLVSTGAIMSNNTIAYSLMDSRRLVHTNAIALPGNSGGPAINSDGKIEGIVVEMELPLEYSSPGQKKKVLKHGNFPIMDITASVIYHMDIWGEKIRSTIEAHRKIAKTAKNFSVSAVSGE